VSSARSYPILQQTQVAIESLLPMNPEQYLPGSLKPGEQPAGAQPEVQGEAAPGAAPEAVPAAPAAPAQQSDAEKPADAATTPAETDTQR
jgi:membrane protein required for colicin V production